MTPLAAGMLTTAGALALGYALGETPSRGVALFLGALILGGVWGIASLVGVA